MCKCSLERLISNYSIRSIPENFGRVHEASSHERTRWLEPKSLIIAFLPETRERRQFVGVTPLKLIKHEIY